MRLFCQRTTQIEHGLTKPLYLTISLLEIQRTKVSSTNQQNPENGKFCQVIRKKKINCKKEKRKRREILYIKKKFKGLIK